MRSGITHENTTANYQQREEPKMAWQKLIDGPFTTEYETDRYDYSGLSVRRKCATAEGVMVVDLHEERLNTSPDFGIQTEDGKVYRLDSNTAAIIMAEHILNGAANE